MGRKFYFRKKKWIAKYYDPDTQTLEEEGVYINDKMNGMWFYFDTGKLMKIEKFEKGSLVGIVLSQIKI